MKSLFEWCWPIVYCSTNYLSTKVKFMCKTCSFCWYLHSMTYNMSKQVLYSDQCVCVTWFKFTSELLSHQNMRTLKWSQCHEQNQQDNRTGPHSLGKHSGPTELPRGKHWSNSTVWSGNIGEFKKNSGKHKQKTTGKYQII